MAGVEILPWSADGGYYGGAACERLDDGETEIFGFCREDEDVGLTEKLPFFVAIDTTCEDDDVGESEFLRLGAQRIYVVGFAFASYDYLIT